MGKILVTGATGQVGRVTREALTRVGLPVRAASRDPKRLSVPASVERVSFDYTLPDTFDPALDGVDQIFIMAPPGTSTPHQILAPFIEVAAKRVSKIVALTAAGIETDDFLPLRELEIQIEESGVNYVFLRPNWFMDNFHSLWLPGIRNNGVISVPAGDAKTAFIDARDVGACAAAAFLSNKFDKKGFTLSGTEALTYAEAAAVLSAASGRPIRYEQPADNETFQNLLLDNGVPPGYASTMLRRFEMVREGQSAETSNIVEEMTGTPARKFKAYARFRADSFRLPTAA